MFRFYSNYKKHVNINLILIGRDQSGGSLLKSGILWYQHEETSCWHMEEPCVIIKGNVMPLPFRFSSGNIISPGVL